jgi:hypothetical protein
MKVFGLVLAAIVLLFSGAARAQARYAPPPRYAQPPDGYWEPPAVPETSDSTVRVNLGPALRLGEGPVLGGLGAAIDIGAKAAGARFSGAWFRAGSDGGLSQYAGELWIDLGAQKRVRPIIGAGAGVARLDALAAGGSIATSTIGIALLRGTLEYVLPIAGVDGRVGVDVEGALPAIRSQSAPDVAGWITTTARVGVGF